MDRLWAHPVVALLLPPPQQCCGQKKPVISTHFLKIQLCAGWEGRGGVATFTNNNENVPTLLTSIALRKSLCKLKNEMKKKLK